MDEDVKRKALAAGKVALGVGRMVSGVVMATGHGLAGAALRKHHMLGAAARYGSKSVEAGAKMVEEGLSEW